jgi:hypothetical protein
MEFFAAAAYLNAFFVTVFFSFPKKHKPQGRMKTSEHYRRWPWSLQGDRGPPLFL